MEEKNRELDALLSMYNSVLNDIAFYQNQGDSTDVKNVIPLAIIPLLEVFEINPFVISLICLFVPVIQCLSLQRGLQAHKFVAMLRGYAADLEDSINDHLGEKHFLYNSVLIDRYIASDTVVKSKGMKTSWLATIMMHYAILAVCIAFFINQNPGEPWWFFIVPALIYLFFAYFIRILCMKFAKKEQDRFTSRELAQTLRTSNQIAATNVRKTINET